MKPLLKFEYVEKKIIIMRNIPVLLDSDVAMLYEVETTIAIIKIFTKFRELSRTIAAIPEVKDEPEQKSLMKKSGEIIGELLDDGLAVSSSETTIELNFAINMKIKL